MLISGFKPSGLGVEVLLRIGGQRLAGGLGMRSRLGVVSHVWVVLGSPLSRLNRDT